MIVNELFDVSVFRDGKVLDIEPSNIKLTLHESIHSLYPTAKLVINDVTGMLRDNFFGIEGFSLSFSLNNTQMTSITTGDFVVYQNDYDQTNKSRLMTGDLVLDMVHDYYSVQEVKSEAYKNRISSILPDLIDNYPFSKIDKNDTGSKSTWYRMFSTQKDFIEQVLLPNAYSDNANESPFFSFITLSNEFHFNNYKYMTQQSTRLTLEYKPVQEQTLSPYIIYKLKPLYVGSKKHKHLRNENYYTRDKETGVYEFEELKLAEFPKNTKTSKKLPAIYDDSLVTSCTAIGFSKEEVGEKEALKARIRYQQKDGLFIERYQITTILNQELVVGKTVTIDVYVPSSNGVTASRVQSDDFLIEDCIHHWDGSNKKGSTECIVSRKFVTVPNTSLIKGSML